MTAVNPIEEKFQTFLLDPNKLMENQKIPGWIKPFIVLQKNFIKEITLPIHTFRRKGGSVKSVTGTLLTDRDNMKVKLENQLQYTRRNMILTVNDRLSAAALIKVFRFLGAALIRLRRLFDCGAYFKDC